METPNSPILMTSPPSPRSPRSPSPASHSLPPHEPSPPSPLPLTSPLRTHPKRNLPPTLSATSPHGHISGRPRTPSQQRSFEARKTEILNTMSSEQIEKRYIEVTEKAKSVFEEAERGRRDVDAKMEAARVEREMERRVWEKRVRGRREGG